MHQTGACWTCSRAARAALRAPHAPPSLGTGLELSGIVAIMFAGIIMAVYTRLNFSPDAQATQLT